MADKRWDFTNPVDIAEDFARGNWTHVNDTSELHQWSGERCGEISATVMRLNDENTALKAERDALVKNAFEKVDPLIDSLRSRVEAMRAVVEAARVMDGAYYEDIIQARLGLRKALAALDKLDVPPTKQVPTPRI